MGTPDGWLKVVSLTGEERNHLWDLLLADSDRSLADGPRREFNAQLMEKLMPELPRRT